MKGDKNEKSDSKVKGKKGDSNMAKDIMVRLNERSNGFCVKLNSTGDFIRSQQKQIKLFGNLEFAETFAYVRGAENSRDFELFVYINGSIIPYDSIQKVGNGIYEFYGEVNDEVIKFIIVESSLRSVMDIKYMVFDKGDENRSYHAKRLVKLWRGIEEALEDIASTTNLDMECSNDHIKVSVRHTTATLYICTNSYILNLNMERKKRDSMNYEYYRAFPYMKNMDRYTTMYSFIVKEHNEPDYACDKILDFLDNLRNVIIDKMVEFEYIQDHKIVPMDFKGDIRL